MKPNYSFTLSIKNGDKLTKEDRTKLYDKVYDTFISNTRLEGTFEFKVDRKGDEIWNSEKLTMWPFLFVPLPPPFVA